MGLSKLNTAKLLLLVTAFFATFAVYSQDSIKIRQIDSLVNAINLADFKVQNDTIIQNQPEVGLYMRTYLTAITNEKELKKYTNTVNATTQNSGVTKQIISANVFYFHNNKLIKVEEQITDDKKKLELFWYYDDNKPIHYNLSSDKAQDRAEFLLTLSKSMLEKFESQQN
ncbi:hypothetical protein [Foetidibacter luteolus]|uniref:hypothetical protein n=1 Tax=Foetidibacter luteolus TaxID=2608880 RepID=UPI00129B1048|nr:hypothetical protein [Foetidibacter luteolus]